MNGSKTRTVGQIRSGSRTRTRTVAVRRDDGTVAGTQTEHWSGRVDAVATPQPVKPDLRVEGR